MANENIKLTITADDNASKEINKVNKSLGETEKASKTAGASFKGAFADMGGAIVVAEHVFQALNKVVSETVGLTIDYAAEVRDLQRASGMSSEETSIMIQLFDDMNVQSEVLKQSLRKMAQEGITFSVEKMAEMSDEYLKLEEGSERNKYLLDNFGRAGLEMGKALEIGSDAIKEMADSMDGALILTQDNVDAAREYEIAMDEMNDTVMGLKVAIGNELIPTLTDLTTAFTDMLTLIPDAENGIENLNEAVMDGTISHEEYKDAIDDLLEPLHISIDEHGNLTSNMRGSEDATAALSKETGLYSEEAYNAALATQEWDESEKKLADMFKQEVEPAITSVKDATNNAAEAMKKYTEQLLFNIASADLAPEAALRLAEAMGLVDEKTVYATEKVNTYAQMLDDKIITVDTFNSLVATLADKMDGIPSDVNVDFWLKMHGYSEFERLANAIGSGGMTQSGYTETDPTAKAAGGDVRPGGSYIVGEHGIELLQMGQNGHGQITPMSNITNNYNLGVTTTQSLNTVTTGFAILQAMQ